MKISVYLGVGQFAELAASNDVINFKSTAVVYAKRTVKFNSAPAEHLQLFPGAFKIAGFSDSLVIYGCNLIRANDNGTRMQRTDRFGLGSRQAQRQGGGRFAR